MVKRITFLAAILVLALNHRCLACLRTTLDARAVQWSTLIVQAKLVSVGTPTDFSPAPAQPNQHHWQYQIYAFEISAVLDGNAKPKDQIKVIRFMSAGQPLDSSECGQSLTHDQLQKSFVLLLRPEADLPWGKTPSDADPRTLQVHENKAFIVVHLESTDDLGNEGIEDLKGTISDTRSAENQLTPQQVRAQATTLAQAADDTEADQAEHALLEMGPKGLPTLQSVIPTVSVLGKTRLLRVISAISVPPIASVVQ